MRKAPKTYGTCRLAEGADVAGRRIALIEDIVTTGGAAHDATVVLREQGATVEVVVCAIDRSEPAANRLPEIGLETRSVLTRSDLDRVRAVS